MVIKLEIKIGEMATGLRVVWTNKRLFFHNLLFVFLILWITFLTMEASYLKMKDWYRPYVLESLSANVQK